MNSYGCTFGPASIRPLSRLRLRRPLVLLCGTVLPNITLTSGCSQTANPVTYILQFLFLVYEQLRMHVRTRFHPSSFASTVATSACAALRNRSPEHHINVWMFSDDQPNHLYSTIFLFG